MPHLPPPGQIGRDCVCAPRGDILRSTTICLLDGAAEAQGVVIAEVTAVIEVLAKVVSASSRVRPVLAKARLWMW